MAYNKEILYPSILTPGIYPSGSVKELGLDNDNLEKFSLGNWTSLYRDNRFFVNDKIINQHRESTEPTYAENVPVYLVPANNPTPNEFGTAYRKVYWRFFTELYGYYNPDNVTGFDNFSPVETDDNSNFLVLNESFLDEDGEPVGGVTPSYIMTTIDLPPAQGGLDRMALPFTKNYRLIHNQEDGDDATDVLNFMYARQQELYNLLRDNPIFIEENPNSNDETYGSLTDNNPIKFKFSDDIQLQLDSILNNTLERVVELEDPGTGAGRNIFAVLKMRILFDRPKIGMGGSQIPKGRITMQNSDLNNIPDWEDTFWGYVFGSENPNSYPEPSYSSFYALGITDATETAQAIADGEFDIGDYQGKSVFLVDDKDENGFYNAFIPSLLNDEFGTPTTGIQIPGPTADANVHGTMINYFTDVLGYPNFSVEEQSQEGNGTGPDEVLFGYFGDIQEQVDEYNIGNVDFEVKCRVATDDDIEKNSDDDEFLVYDEKDSRYEKSSYPLKVDLIVDLHDEPNFANDKKPLIVNAYLNASARVNHINGEIERSVNPAQSHYRYQVVQWGDENNLLEDDDFLNSIYFAPYESTNYPAVNNFSLKKNKAEQVTKTKTLFKPLIDYQKQFGGGTYPNVIYNKSSHVYNTPGLKSIKIIVYRYTQDSFILLGTYLVTKNIFISDGLLKSQDFSIIGGTDYNFLPIKDKDVIIGGLDEESEYIQSVSKISKDDNFVKEDYLEKVTANDYIDKFNSGLLGETPGQLDLSQTRMFNKPKDIYDFIGGNKLEWIISGSGTLPIESKATNIFIFEDNDCVVDINPINSELSLIQNQAGVDAQSILIGDYKINQPRNGRISKQSVMDIPLLEKKNSDQAF